MNNAAQLVIANDPRRAMDAHVIHLVDKDGYACWLNGQSDAVRAHLAALRFEPTPFAAAILPGDDAQNWAAIGVVQDRAALGVWCLARLAELLPAGTYRLADGEPGAALLGWMLAQYRFTDYKSDIKTVGPRVLLTGEAASIAEAVAEADATMLVRDLVNRPANAMGPQELEDAVAAIGRPHGARITVTRGDALARGYPMIHAVGAAATPERAPRLIELEWGDSADPRIAIVGKGVCFDTGGLDLKSGPGMLLMKKDMGGAAHALGLAAIIMAMRLPVRLHLLIPAVENAVSGASARPGDIVRSRKGLTVEINNTDAEGRLILADALTRAGECDPALMLDFATLTGAARVALGPDLPALFANRADLATEFAALSQRVDDPVWHMPLWPGYEDMLKTDNADLDNAPLGGFAGAITAALFLKAFVDPGTAWVHLDTFAWRPTARPGRPKGGAALGMRAAWHFLNRRYGGKSTVAKP